MLDLKEKLGLNIKIDGNKLLYDKNEFPTAAEWEKPFEEGKYAYLQPEQSMDILYFGTRYLERASDVALFKEKDIMADLTILNSGRVGDEFVKTVGHYHEHVPGSNLAYPEIYEVISGRIEYLLQSEPDENGAVEVIWVLAEEGDKIVMIPNYGHVGANVGTEIAVEVDFQKRDNPNHSDYSLFKEKTGGAYYKTPNGLTQNTKYKVKSFKTVRTVEKPEWGLVKNKTLYQSFIDNPEKFDWLKNPQNYDFSDIFEEIK